MGSTPKLSWIGGYGKRARETSKGRGYDVA